MIDKLKQGVVNCVVECNPDAGVFVKNAISRYLARGADAIPREIYVHETVFSSDMDFDQIPPRNYWGDEDENKKYQGHLSTDE